MIIHGDCIEKMRELEPNSVDAIVTDPPYGIGFMGKEWDTFKPENVDKPKSYKSVYITDDKNGVRVKRKKPGMVTRDSGARRAGSYDFSRNAEYQEWFTEVSKEMLRVLKPGGFLLAFGGTRTCHRLTCAIEDAGFEIRDMIMWLYGSGFPKSLNIGKAIDKMAGAEREVVGSYKNTITNDDTGTFQSVDRSNGKGAGFKSGDIQITIPSTPEAKQWEGWGTALKPALEPITVARKPLSEKTVAQNVLKWGTGGININSCRIETNEIKTETHLHKSENVNVYGKSTERLRHNGNGTTHIGGRFPANLIHDGSDEVEALFPQTKNGGQNYTEKKSNNIEWKGKITKFAGDSGSASRFFYCAKASKKDRDEGLNGLPTKNATELTGRKEGTKGLSGSEEHGNSTNPYANGGSVLPRANHHPTVKPTKLMQYLVRLVTPKGGTVLDPFAGSGSTGKACKLEGFNFIGIEKEKEYFDIAEARIKHAEPELKLAI